MVRLTTAFLTLLAVASSTVDAQYVKTSGTSFTLNGSQFRFMGTNCYWCSFLTNDADIDLTYKEIAKAGLKVVRIWGFNDVTNTGTNVYYQSWANGVNTPNTGANGLQRLDVNVKTAEKYGLKLVIPMTNNWGDYGGMDVYVSQLANGQGHSAFYTNANIISAYKKYVSAVVSRYTTSSAIMAWQLANEPRCNGCSASTLTNWATTMSSYIKSLDSNHLVSLGDEGFFNHPGSSYIYGGGEGVDFEANLAISSLDYGTFHFYPDSWSVTPASGTTWAADHAAAGKAKNKPVVWEEYGTLTSRDTYIPQWHDAVIANGIAGDQYWQFGLTLSTGKTSNDGYTIYETDSDFDLLVVQHAADMNAGSTQPTTTTTTSVAKPTTTTTTKSATGSCSLMTVTGPTQTVYQTVTYTATVPGACSLTTAGRTTTTTTTTTSSAKPTTTSGSCPNAKYAQCGGQGFTGQACCQAGSTCTYSNQYYSQCL